MIINEILENKRIAITLLKIIIFFLSLKYFLKEWPIAAQAIALVNVDITKQIKIKVNSTS